MKQNLIRNVILETKNIVINEAYNADFLVENFGKGLAKAFKNDRSEEAKDPKWKEFKTDEELARALILKFEDIDPTQDKKYVNYIVRQYVARNPQSELEDLDSAVKPALKLYEQMKVRKRLPVDSDPAKDPRNIMNFKTLVDFLDFTEQFEPPKEAIVNRGRYKEILNNSVLRLIIPLDEQASCYYGQATQWCTASTRSSNYFDSYSRRGPLVIFLPKRPHTPTEKYQFHMDKEGRGGITLMDERDRQVPQAQVVDLIMRRFGDLRPVFEEHTPFRRNEFMAFMDKELIDNFIYTAFKNLRPIDLSERLASVVLSGPAKDGVRTKLKLFTPELLGLVDNMIAASITNVKNGGRDALFANESTTQLKRVDDVEKEIERTIADAIVAPLLNRKELTSALDARIANIYKEFGKPLNSQIHSVLIQNYYEIMISTLKEILISEL